MKLHKLDRVEIGLLVGFIVFMGVFVTLVTAFLQITKAANTILALTVALMTYVFPYLALAFLALCALYFLVRFVKWAWNSK